MMKSLINKILYKFWAAKHGVISAYRFARDEKAPFRDYPTELMKNVLDTFNGRTDLMPEQVRYLNAMKFEYQWRSKY